MERATVPGGVAYPAQPIYGIAPLPVPASLPIGRDDDMRRLQRWFGDGARTVTLVGQPGAGKTRLALHVAGHMQSDAGLPAMFCPLAPLSSATQIMNAIAVALSVSDDSATPELPVKRRLNEFGPFLLVLDNLEHLDGADTVVAVLLGACPDERVLATSRRELRVAGERPYLVGPLPVPEQSATLAEMRANPAAQLFVNLAGRSGFAVVEPDLPVVCQICAHVDGLPLAIELASAKAAAMGLMGLEQHLQDHRALLDISANGSNDRTSSIRASIAWSYKLLEPEVQVALNRLSRFTGGFSLTTARKVLGGRPTMVNYVPSSLDFEPNWAQDNYDLTDAVNVRPLLIDGASEVQHLLDANLIQSRAGADGEPRFIMLESIREFGLERLEASEELADVRYAHAIAMLQFGDLAGYELWTERTTSRYWPLIAEEQGNLRLVLEYACDPANELTLLAQRMIGSIWFHFQLSGQAAEGRNWLERIVALPGGSPASRLQILNSLAFTAWTQGDNERAAEATEMSIKEWAPPAAPNSLGIAWFNMALVEWRRGNFPLMAQHLFTAKPILHDSKDFNGEGFCDLALGMLARLSGDHGQAEMLLEEAFQLLMGAGHAWGAATARYLAGEAAHDVQDTRVAAQRLAEGLQRYWTLRDVYGSGACVAALAVMAAERSELQRAARMFGASFAMTEYAGVMLPPVDLERYQKTAAHVGTLVDPMEFAIGRGWSPGHAVDQALRLAGEIEEGRVPGPVDDPVAELLTEDQLDAVNLLVKGQNPEEIAKLLSRARNTIYDRLQRAREQLGVTDNTKLVSRVNDLRSGKAL